MDGSQYSSARFVAEASRRVGTFGGSGPRKDRKGETLVQIELARISDVCGTKQTQQRLDPPR